MAISGMSAAAADLLRMRLECCSLPLLGGIAGLQAPPSKARELGQTESAFTKHKLITLSGGGTDEYIIRCLSNSHALAVRLVRAGHELQLRRLRLPD